MPRPPAQSTAVLSARAATRTRNPDGTFADEHKMPDMPKLSDIETSFPDHLLKDQSADASVSLQGSMARKGKTPTQQQARVESALKTLFQEGGWQEALSLRRRRGYHPYSKMNMLNIWHHYHPRKLQAVASASEWEKRGRRVKDDADGAVVWVKRTKTQLEEVEPSEDNPDGIKKLTRQFYDRPPEARVYDYSDTEPIPGVEEQTTRQKSAETFSLSDNVSPEEACASLESVVNELGLKLEHYESNMMTRQYGFLNVNDETGKADRIVLDAMLSKADQVAVMAHELGHYFDPVLRREDDKEKFDYEGYLSHKARDAEIVAEMTSMSVSMELGLDTSGNAIPYLHLWDPGKLADNERIKWTNNILNRWQDAHSAVIDALEKVDTRQPEKVLAAA